MLKIYMEHICECVCVRNDTSEVLHFRNVGYHFIIMHRCFSMILK